MTLICDCGATKAEWVLLDGADVVKRFVTDGFNPNFCDNDTMNGVVRQSITNIANNNDVDNIFFYGTGCGSSAGQVKVKLVLSKFYPLSNVEVYPDSLGACHALFGNNSGIACILGTGSNACCYDGEKITQTITSLGFMIGDEGSGCHIGKRIIHDYFVGIMPDELRAEFDAKYHLDRDSFLKKVYQGGHPSRYLAQFSKFAGKNIDNQYVKKVVGECLEEFVKVYLIAGTWHVSPVKNVSFVGSIAYAYKDILTKCLDNHNIKCGKILKKPMDGLIKYYKNQNATESLIL